MGSTKTFKELWLDWLIGQCFWWLTYIRNRMKEVRSLIQVATKWFSMSYGKSGISWNWSIKITMNTYTGQVPTSSWLYLLEAKWPYSPSSRPHLCSKSNSHSLALDGLVTCFKFSGQQILVSLHYSTTQFLGVPNFNPQMISENFSGEMVSLPVWMPRILGLSSHMAPPKQGCGPS